MQLSGWQLSGEQLSGSNYPVTYHVALFKIKSFQYSYICYCNYICYLNLTCILYRLFLPDVWKITSVKLEDYLTTRNPKLLNDFVIYLSVFAFIGNFKKAVYTSYFFSKLSFMKIKLKVIKTKCRIYSRGPTYVE